MDNLIRRKITAIFIVFSLLLIAVVVRLAWINVVDGQALRDVVQEQKLYTVALYPDRGDVLDRNGEVLAYSRNTYRVAINRFIGENDNTEIVNKTIDNIIKKIAPIIEMPEFEIREILKNSSNKTVVITYITDKDKYLELRLSSYKRLQVDLEVERQYPLKGSLADVLGLTKRDDNQRDIIGDSGIEKTMNAYMTGQEGLYRTETDKWNNQLYGVKPFMQPPSDGDDVYLTIDTVIQQSVEEHLKNAFEEWNPKGVHGIVMNVNSGEILSMASYPTFDPSDRSIVGLSEEQLSAMSIDEQNQKFVGLINNDNISSIFEVGSTIKLITTAAALEEDLYTPDSVFDEGNEIYVDGVSIKCWNYPRIHGDHGRQTLTEAVENSCNPVFVKMGQALGPETLIDYFDGFGLRNKIKLELPAMQEPSLFYLESNRPIDFATMTFGHGESYTPLHVVMAISALVNGGDLLEPQIIKKVVTEMGESYQEAERTVVRSVISDITSQQIRTIMESVVDNGSGKKAAIEGLRIGGKTGTAEKYDHDLNEYSSDKGVASFVGVMPIDDPEVIVYILVDEPEGNMMGSQVAAPIAREIMLDISEYYEYQRTHITSQDVVSVPLIEGLTVEEATELLESIYLELRITNASEYTEDFIIKNQYPIPGAEVSSGIAVLVEISE